jgi:hypothetical protein
MTSFADNIHSFNAVLKLVSVASIIIDKGRWLKIVIPAIYAPLLYFVTLIAGKCKFLRALVLYVLISLLKLNICLLLIMYRTNEYIYWS